MKSLRNSWPVFVFLIVLVLSVVSCAPNRRATVLCTGSACASEEPSDEDPIDEGNPPPLECSLAVRNNGGGGITTGDTLEAVLTVTSGTALSASSGLQPRALNDGQAVWNFPASSAGTFVLEASVSNSGEDAQCSTEYTVNLPPAPTCVSLTVAALSGGALIVDQPARATVVAGGLANSASIDSHPVTLVGNIGARNFTPLAAGTFTITASVSGPGTVGPPATCSRTFTVETPYVAPQPPVISLTLNGNASNINRPTSGNVAVAWLSDSGTCSLTGGSAPASGLSGSFNVPVSDILQQRTFSLSCTNGVGTTTQTRRVLVPYKQVYFAYTAQGDFDRELDQMVAGVHALSGYNFKTQPFRVLVDERLLSRVNYGGVVNYPASAVQINSNSGQFAEIVGITRNFAERDAAANAANSRCTIISDTVFAANRFDLNDLASGSYLNLSAEPAPAYVFKDEVRDRWAVSNAGCYPSIHSSRTERLGSPVLAPTFSAYPWVSDGYSNTYGNGAYIYVDAAGKLRFRYKSQTGDSRVVFLVGIIAPN